jgi:biotin carboxyl carrier protein
MTEKETTYTVKINEFTFSFSRREIEAADIIQISRREYNLVKDDRSVNATVVEADCTSKKCRVEVEGENFDVEIKEPLDIKLDEMGFNKKASQKISEIKAPMPGLVLEISVSEGQQVSEGDKLLILVAMKMENSIKIGVGATIKRIAVVAGQAVDKGQLLVELE